MLHTNVPVTRHLCAPGTSKCQGQSGLGLSAVPRVQFEGLGTEWRNQNVANDSKNTLVTFWQNYHVELCVRHCSEPGGRWGDHCHPSIGPITDFCPRRLRLLSVVSQEKRYKESITKCLVSELFCSILMLRETVSLDSGLWLRRDKIVAGVLPWDVSERIGGIVSQLWEPCPVFEVHQSFPGGPNSHHHSRPRVMNTFYFLNAYEL